nr:Sjogren's syndrome/scleroderma autoantigen 1 family protein [Candidatus Njordarchaeum guaymaensis]
MNEVIKKMAESLRAGATMLPDNCSVCNSPLFRLENRTYCVKCGSSPTLTPALASAPPASPQVDSVKAMIPQMTSTVLAKLKKLRVEVDETSDPVRLSQMSELMLTLLKILEVLERLGKSK